MPTKQQEKGLYKRGKIYWLFYTRGGKKNSVSTKTTSKSEAIKFKYEFLENLDKQDNIDNNVNNIININTTNSLNQDDDSNKNIIINNTAFQTQIKHLLGFIIAKFLEEKERKLKEKTLKNYNFMLKHILSFFKEDTVIENITKIQIKDYEKYRLVNGCTEGYLIKELKLLKEIFNFAAENDLLNNYNLFDRYKFRKVYNDYGVRERFLTSDECIKIIENSNEYLKRLIIFLLETGLRIKEALNLQYTDIAYDKQNNINFARIRKEVSKNKKERFVPLSLEAMEQLNKQHIEFHSSLYIFTDSNGNAYKTCPKRALKTALAKAQIEDTKNIGFHIFRHTFASQKLQGINYKGESIKPVRIEIISQILGHSSIDITSKVYAKLDKSSLVEMIG